MTLEEYERREREAANKQKQNVDKRYGQLTAQAELDAAAAVEKTGEQYQALFDANAVDELVARRNAAEAIANSNLANSGLNNTQQTAISLSRQRADHQTSLARQAAVDSIMRQLDQLKAENAIKADEDKATIDATAESNVASFRQEAEQQALEVLTAQYEKDKAAAMIDSGRPSMTAIDAQSRVYARQGGGKLEDYLSRMVYVGNISESQRQSLLAKYGGATGADSLSKAATDFVKYFPDREKWNYGANARAKAGGDSGASYDLYLRESVVPNIISRANRKLLTEGDVAYLFSLYGITEDMIP